MIQGYYMDGKTSRHVPARLEVCNTNSNSVYLYLDYSNETDNEPSRLEFNHKDLNVHSRLADTPREISLPDNQLFISEDHSSIDQYLKGKQQGKLASCLHYLESHLAAISIATIITIVVIWGFIVHGIPKSAEFIAYNMPVDTIQELGSSLDMLDKTTFESSELSKERQAHVRELAAPYLQQHKDLHPSLEFRSGMKANAFALPGGQIVFTDDLINLLDRDEEIIAVLLHELGHLKHKHLVRRILQDSMITLLVIFVTGDVDSFDIITGIPTLLVDLSYSRHFETEADEYALTQLHKTNIPLDNFSNVMTKIEDFYKDLAKEKKQKRKKFSIKIDTQELQNYLSTHPLTEERLALVEEFKIKYNQL